MTEAESRRTRLNRWRLVLGGDDADGITTPDGTAVVLSAGDAAATRP